MRRSTNSTGFAGTKGGRIGSAFGLVIALAFLLAGAPAHAYTYVKPSDKEDAKVDPQLKTPPKGTRLHVVTDRLTYDARTKIAVATGRVIITYGKYVLVARRVVYDKRNDRMRAVGSVHLREPGGNILQADIAQLQNRFRDGFARHLRLLLTNDATITADYARRTKGYITTYQRVTYTRCKDCKLANGLPLWQIRSVKVKHDEKEGVIYHTDASFQFLGATVFWLPKLSHPDPNTKRKTGFLIPEFNFSSTYGLGVGLPYFINLAPNYDLTLRPFITSKQGPLLRATWRHRLASGQYTVDAAGIYQLSVKNIAPPGNRRLRGYVRTVGDFHLNRRWRYGWDVTQVSDDTFGRRYDLDSRIDHVNRGHLTGINKRNFLTMELLHFKGLLATDNNKTYPYALPYFQYNYMFDKPVLGGDFGIDTTVYKINRATPLAISAVANQGDDQTRALVEAHWQRRMVSNGGLVLTPFARLRADMYITDKVPGATKANDVTTRIFPTAGFDLRYPLVSSNSLGQQVFTPVMQFVTSRNETKRREIGNEDAVGVNFDTSNLFLHTRFSGKDRFEGGTRANVGFLYSWLFNNGGAVKFSLGQSYHLAGRNSFGAGSGLSGNYSDIVAAFTVQPNTYFSLNYQTRIDDRRFNFKSHEAWITGQYGGLFGTVAYTNLPAAPLYGRPLAQHQIWGDAEYFFTDRWSVFGGARYDFTLNRFYQHRLGIAYHCDCFNFRLYFRDTNAGDRDAKGGQSIIMAVEFKTLGGARIGSGL